MSTDQQPASYDPRYDHTYQRGGSAAVQGHDVGQRSVAPEEPRRTTTPVSAHEQRRVDAPAVEPVPDPAIREVGAPPEAPQMSVRARNPFDVWVWVVAAALTALGVYFLTAPIVGAEAYAKQMMSQSGSGMSMGPWWQHTSLASLPLILLGIGTAVAQLFVLSIRHTLRAR